MEKHIKTVYVQRWLLNGLLHREDGPAYIHIDGHQEWHIHGECHRLDGPAVIYSNGALEWYYQGELLPQIKSQSEFEKYLKLKIFS